MADLASTRIFGRLTVIHEAILKANAEITGDLTVLGDIVGNIDADQINSGTLSTSRLPASALVGDTTYSAGSGLSLSGTTFTNTAPNVTTNLSYTAASSQGTVVSSDGTNAVIPAATTSNAGLMSSGDKSKLNNIESGAQANVATNLGSSRNATSYTVTSSTGSNTTLSAATTSNAGVMGANDKSKLDGIQAGAEVNTVTSVAGKTGSVSLAAGDISGLSDAATTTVSAIRSGTTKANVGLSNVNNTSDADKPISTATQSALNAKVNISDIVNGLTSSASNLPLSAAQGKVLKDAVDNINNLLQSDDTTLDELQEIVDFIKLNRAELENLGVSNITGLQSALDSKVDKVSGKGLSTEDFTSAFKTKLEGIETGAEVNVATNLGNSASSNSVTLTSSTGTNTSISAATTLDAGVMSAADKTKLAGIETGAEVNPSTTASRTSSSTSVVLQARAMNDHRTSGDHDGRYVQLTGNQTISDTKTFSGVIATSGLSGSAASEVVLRTGFTGTAGGDNVHVHLQGVDANDNSGGNFNGGAFIRFSTSTSGDYGAFIGGRRQSSGASHFVIKTGGQNPTDSMVVDESGNVIASRGEFQGDGSGLTGTASLRATGTTKADVGLGSVDNYSRSHYDGRYVRKDARSEISTTTSTTEPLLKLNGTNNAGIGVVLLGGEIASNTSDRFFMEFKGSGSVNWAVSTDGTLRVGEVPAARLSGTIATARLPASALIGDTTYSAGSGLSLSGTTFTNTAPHQATNLGTTVSGDTRTITSSTGSNVTIPVATGSAAGVMSRAMVNKLAGIDTGAEVNPSTTASRTSSSTSTVLQAKAMNDHRTSGDHDGRYHTISSLAALGFEIENGELKIDAGTLS